MADRGRGIGCLGVSASDSSGGRIFRLVRGGTLSCEATESLLYRPLSTCQPKTRLFSPLSSPGVINQTHFALQTNKTTSG